MVKEIIKRVIGQKRINAVKQRLQYIEDVSYLRRNPRIQVEKDDLLYQKFAQKNRHVFFGYYDLSPFDAKEKRFLVHCVKKGADPHKDKAELGFYTMGTCKYVPFATTDAWCWQQGSRLRWHPYEKNIVLFNDIEKGRYVTRMFDVKQRRNIGTICDALYDVSPDFTYGLSLNFSRLQRLRPGYGYSVLPDKTAHLLAPEEDGIFYVDLQKNKGKLLISLAELAAEISDPQAAQHYINHISISPDGRKFLFFHIWTLQGDTHWRTRLCVYSMDSGKINVLEKKDRVSHYDWKNDNEILVTCWKSKNEQYYCLYDLADNKKTVLENIKLKQDGHPSVFGRERYFVSDTYPLKHDMQTLFEYDFLTDHYRPLLHLYSDARLYDEKRCDLHPRISKSEKYITLDTTCEDGCKQVMLIKNWRE